MNQNMPCANKLFRASLFVNCNCNVWHGFGATLNGGGRDVIFTDFKYVKYNYKYQSTHFLIYFFPVTVNINHSV